MQESLFPPLPEGRDSHTVEIGCAFASARLRLNRSPLGRMTSDQLISTPPQKTLEVFQSLLTDTGEAMMWPYDLGAIQQIPFKSCPVDETAHQLPPTAPVSASKRP